MKTWSIPLLITVAIMTAAAWETHKAAQFGPDAMRMAFLWHGGIALVVSLVVWLIYVILT